jgi:hypothetical protein
MIPRRIGKSQLNLSRVLALSLTACVAVLVWTVGASLPLLVRGTMGLLVASAGLFLIFGRWQGRPVLHVLWAGVRYTLRARRRVWARGRRSGLSGSALRRPPTWWWGLVERVFSVSLPSRQAIIAAVVATVVTLLATAGVFWVRAQQVEPAVVSQVTPISTVMPAVAPPPVATATPVPPPTLTPAPTALPPAPVPALVHSVAMQEWAHQPGYLYLAVTKPLTLDVSFVEDGGAYTATLLLQEEAVVPLVPAFHPRVNQVQVWGDQGVKVEQGLYTPYRCRVAKAWWIWVDPDFAARYIVLYPHSEAAGAGARLPDGEEVVLTPGRKNRLARATPGLYQVHATRPFCLEVWFEF